MRSSLQTANAIRFHFAPRPRTQLWRDVGRSPDHRADDDAHPHARPGRGRQGEPAGRRVAARLHRARLPADDPQPVALHRGRGLAGAHVPRQRNDDLVRQRRRPVALRAAGAADKLAGAARRAAARVVRLALGEPARDSS